MTTSPNHDQLYQFAEMQAGYFTTAQARTAEFSHALLAYHVQAGLFERICHGVYRLKRFPASPHEDLFVAWLRAGNHAVISHDSALALYDLSDLLPNEIHLTVPRTASRRHPGLRLHTNQLEPADVTHYAGLPVITVPRTIADVAASGLSEELVGQAIREALRRGLTTIEQLRMTASRCQSPWRMCRQACCPSTCGKKRPMKYATSSDFRPTLSQREGAFERGAAGKEFVHFGDDAFLFT